MAYENILTETVGEVGVVQINRPKDLNALNDPTVAEIMDALEAFDADPEVGCMVLTGSEKAFAAGADIKQMSEASPLEMYQTHAVSRYDRMRRIGKPVIAAVSGWCLGGGCELAMSCDMIVASEKATFGQPEINVGIIPGSGGTQRLTRAVGKALAMEMILNARFLKAEEAYQFGLVNRVFPVESYRDEAIALAQQIAERAPVAVRLAKEAINAGFELSLNEAISFERRNFFLLFATEDQKEGMRAFIEKRDPNWQGK
jgi:enoyl-CoA hydratase